MSSSAPPIKISSHLNILIQMEIEARTAKLLDTEHQLLESIFPHHIVEALTDAHNKSDAVEGGGNTDDVTSPEPSALNEASASLAGLKSEKVNLGRSSHASFTNKRRNSSTIRLQNDSSLEDIQHLSTHHKEVCLPVLHEPNPLD